MPVTALDRLAGTVIGDRYQLRSVIGSGGMGTVFEAVQLGLGRSVAVKVLHGSADPLVQQRFRAEALAASRINHPHAISIFDFDVTVDGLPYLVMERLRGAPLSTLLDEGPLPVERVVAIADQVLSALIEAHARGVVHCDLTSDNVIVERTRGGADFAKVIDFGLARLVDGGAASAAAGTPEYMAPEQIRGESVGPAADVYAVGVLLYEMLVGRTPFAGAATAVVLDGHLHADPEPPHGIQPQCPPALGQLVLRTLDKVAGNRPDARTLRSAVLGASGRPAEVVCPACGEPTPRGGSFCAACGARLGPKPQPRPQPAARGSVDVARPARPTRMTLELAPTAAGEGLVGRSGELARVIEFCRRGAGAMLGITGARGVGKARLVAEAARQLRPSMLVIAAGADPSGLDRPWYPVLALLEQCLEIEGTITVDSLTSAVARCGLSERDVPGLAEVFGLPGPAGELELAVRRREAHAAALRALVASGRRAPRILICAVDVHDYDQPSRRVLTALAEAITSTNLRLLVTAADDADLPPGGEVLPLGPLTDDDAHALLLRLAGDRIPNPASVRELTGGSPLAIEQLAGWLAAGNSAAAAPSLLVDLVSVRLGRLPAAARRVLQAVAVHGSVASRRLVAATLGETELPRIDEAEAAGLLTVDDGEVALPSRLIAATVDAATPADVRRTFHRHALAALPPTAPPAQVAQLAEGCGDLVTAYDCWRLAGDDAVRRFDDDGATRYYRLALACAQRLVDTGHDDAGERRLETALRLSEVLAVNGHPDEAARTLAAVEGLARGPRWLARLHRATARVLLARNDIGGAVAGYRYALGEGIRAGDAALLCEVWIDLAKALERAGDSATAIAELAEAVDVITGGTGFGGAGAPSSLWYLGLLLAERYLSTRDLERARRAAEGALELATRQGSARGRARLSALLARILDVAGEPAAALRHRANAIDEMRRLGDRRSTAELLIDNAHTTPRRADGADEQARGLALAARLAGEIGWQEGVARSKPD